MKKLKNSKKIDKKLKNILVLHLLFAMAAVSMMQHEFSLNQIQPALERQHLNNSGYWTENDFGYIHIDNNWSAADAAYAWVQWDSTHSNYVIENVSLDCTGNPFGIFIENSNTYDFEIRNCSIYNAGSYAIRIYNTDSGIIEDCHLYGNDDGVSIEGGSNAIVVQDCVIENNDVYGVYLESSNFNTVRRSNLTSNNVGIFKGTKKRSL